MHGHGAKAHPVSSYDRVEPFEEVSTPYFSKKATNGNATTYRTHDPTRRPHMRSFQDCDPFLQDEHEDEKNISEHLERAHVLAPPATIYGRTPSSEINDNAGENGFDFSETPTHPKHTITFVPRYRPKLTTVPISASSEQANEENKKIMVDVDFLHKLESKISDLQSRVEDCEAAPGSPTNSSIRDSQDSVDSVSDLSHSSLRAARDSRHIDDDITIYEPEVRQGRRSPVNFEGPSLAIARWKYFGKSQKFEAVDGGKASRPDAQDLRDRPLLTLVEEYHSNSKLWRKRLEIASPAFLELLKEVSCHNISEVASYEGEMFYLTEPFMVLFLNRKQLTNYVENTEESTQVKEHAKFILDFLKSDFSDTSRVLDNFESLTPPNLVKYCDLWMLYRPGTMVYSRTNGEWEAFIIDSLDGMQLRKPSPDNSHGLTRLDILAWSMNFDGEVYGRVWTIHCVAPFHGVMEISSLPLVPEEFLLDRNTVRESLLSRGKKFRTLQVQHCQESDVPSSQSTRVMIDHLTYQKRNGWLISIDGKYGPSSAKERSWIDNRHSDWDTSGAAFDRRPRRYTPQRSLVRHFEDEYCNRDYELESIDKSEDTQAEPCRSYSTDRPSHIVVRGFKKYDLIQPDAEMDELTLMLCPQHVRGFCLRDKVWSKCAHHPIPCVSNSRSEFINVSQLKPVSFQENVWDRLALDEEYKDILEAMVISHVDKVAGLRGSAGGKGLSILLHGKPGVGKTLTAGMYSELVLALLIADEDRKNPSQSTLADLYFLSPAAISGLP